MDPCETWVEGLPWVPDRPTLGSRFFSGLCQVPAHKTVSCGFPRVFRFPQLLLKPEEGYPRFPSQQEVSVGSVSNRGRRWVLADRSTGEHSCACTWTWTQIHQKGYVPDAARPCPASESSSASELILETSLAAAARVGNAALCSCAPVRQDPPSTGVGDGTQAELLLRWEAGIDH